MWVWCLILQQKNWPNRVSAFIFALFWIIDQFISFGNSENLYVNKHIFKTKLSDNYVSDIKVLPIQIQLFLSTISPKENTEKPRKMYCGEFSENS